MGRHSRDNDDKIIRGEVPLEDMPPLKEGPSTGRTFERDSGGIQGVEYFGVDTRDEEGN